MENPTITQLRQRRSLEQKVKKEAEIKQVLELVAKGKSNAAIARIMGKNESSIRALRKAASKEYRGL